MSWMKLAACCLYDSSLSAVTICLLLGDFVNNSSEKYHLLAPAPAIALDCPKLPEVKIAPCLRDKRTPGGSLVQTI